MKSYAQALAVMEGGAGLLCDQALREFLLEINHRFWGHGLGAMPISFNVLEAFTEFHEEAARWFGLLPERDHVFSLGDFLDFATGADGPSDPAIAVAALPEGVIHSYNAVGNLKDLAFLHANGSSFVTGGITFVRRADEISWLLIGGPVTDLNVETERIVQEWNTELGEMQRDNPKHLDLTDSPELRAVALPGAEDVWKTHHYGRFNLSSGRHEVRYLARDAGSMYETLSDDPSIYWDQNPAKPSPEFMRYLELGQQSLDENALLTEIATTCFGLPAYFRFKIQLVRERERESRLNTTGGLDQSARRALAKVPPDRRVLFRRVAALADHRSFTTAGGARVHAAPVSGRG